MAAYYSAVAPPWNGDEMKTVFERLNALDVLLLVFVKHGLATTYELRSQAGIGGSLTVKQLQLLEKNGLLASTSGNERKAKRYAITEAGEKKLLEALDLEMQKRGRLGIESMARALFLEWLYPNQISGAETERATAAALDIYRKEKELEAERLKAAIDQIKRRSPGGDYGSQAGQLVANTFMWIRARSDVALLMAQSKVLDPLVGLSKELPPAPMPVKIQSTDQSTAKEAASPSLSRWRPARKRKRT
jgi:DNA-binding PadR family transcriptional regulator